MLAERAQCTGGTDVGLFPYRLTVAIVAISRRPTQWEILDKTRADIAFAHESIAERATHDSPLAAPRFRTCIARTVHVKRAARASEAGPEQAHLLTGGNAVLSWPPAIAMLSTSQFDPENAHLTTASTQKWRRRNLERPCSRKTSPQQQSGKILQPDPILSIPASRTRGSTTCSRIHSPYTNHWPASPANRP